MIIPRTILCPMCSNNVIAKQDAFGTNQYFRCHCVIFDKYTHNGINLVCDHSLKLKHGTFHFNREFEVSIADPRYLGCFGVTVKKFIMDSDGDVLSSKILFNLSELYPFDFSKPQDIPKLIGWINMNTIFS